jgi:hypothetical protein
MSRVDQAPPAPVGPYALPLAVWVPGRARTKGSLRVRSYRANGSAVLAEQVRGSKDWRETVVETVLRQLGATFTPHGPVVTWSPYAGPVEARMAVWLPRPLSGRGAASPYPDQLRDGDLDKYQRNVGDALTDTRIIDDDGQIVTWAAAKLWADPTAGRHPGAWIEVRPVQA